MKLLMIHAWNEEEMSYRGRFSGMLSYPSMTLAVLYSLVPKGLFERVDTIDENSARVEYDRERYDLVMRREALQTPAGEAILEILRSAAFKKEIRHFTGNDYRDMGKIVAEV